MVSRDAALREATRQNVLRVFAFKKPRGKQPGLLHPIPLGQRPFGTVHMDHVGPFITTAEGNKYILALVDNFTKFIVLYAVATTKAEPMLSCVEEFVKKYGLPRRFITDRGTCFTSDLFDGYCADQGIQLVLTSSRHPQANGQVERTHSVVMTMLIAHSDSPEKWDLALHEVQNNINNSESKVTNCTPFEMLHGYRPRFRLGKLRVFSKTSEDWTPPDELRSAVREQMELAKNNMKQAYDRRRHDNLHCTVGEIVVMKRATVSTGESTKLQERYRRPLIVTEVLPGDVYRVAQLKAGRKSRFATTAHISQLKSWRIERGQEEEPDEEEEEDQEEEPDEEEEGDQEEGQDDEEKGKDVGQGADKSQPYVAERSKREKRVPVRFEDYELN